MTGNPQCWSVHCFVGHCENGRQLHIPDGWLISYRWWVNI